MLPTTLAFAITHNLTGSSFLTILASALAIGIALCRWLAFASGCTCLWGSMRLLSTLPWLRRQYPTMSLKDSAIQISLVVLIFCVGLVMVVCTTVS